MNGSAPTHPTFYRPADVATMLHCSVWWVKEQARRRRIPYCRIGGGYRFTDAHIAEIARLFEVQPGNTPAAVHQRRTAIAGVPMPTAGLRARPPRRLRDNDTRSAA